ncbi:hypothetical protein [Candidatus Contubernalis alkaliaceticus]|uniref:hypothetical protein n=1 Tax=Candidatus Contubernalis alkaliaceticus TaxID=338645 RepID=UPI001F4BE76F|nr:hypothetical protein [Candidatus Contubernalis alkalaceticus]UNC92464.1 hypothetical protein HUE98_10370 [Candidatus Contubernalis alkalaceticus]
MAAFALVNVYFNRDCFSYKPFANGPELSSPLFYKIVDNKDQYFIDQGNQRIIAIDEEGKSKWTYINTDTSYKELVQAPNGRIFVTNYRYIHDTVISTISIDEFSNSGKFLGSIYSVSYPVKQLFDKTSQIMDLQFVDDMLTFVTRTDEKLHLYSINLNENNKLQLKASVSWDNKKEHAIKYCYDHDKEIFYVITAMGNIYEIATIENDAKLLFYPKEDGFNIPFSMTLVGGNLVVSDIGSRTVNVYDGQSFMNIVTMKKGHDFFTDPALYYSITSASQNEVTLTTGYDAYLLNVDTEILTPINTDITFSTMEHARIIFAWVCGLILLILGFGLIIIYAKYSVVISATIIFYGFNQSVLGLVLSSVAFAFVDSFFDAVRNIYLTQLPESIKYGQGSTLAFSNIVTSIAQFGQSYIFAFAIIFGIKKSFLIIGVTLLVLTVLFLKVNNNRDNKKKQNIFDNVSI